ncbi:MAG TPA: arginine deiminase family protein [Pyrinomonadaceae bacterium]|nr:arginine deiminase family protein [Pyrinomonadaceae bacterium]
MEDCELTFLSRDCIDVAKAEEQHQNYVRSLTRMGLRVLHAPPTPDLPDSVFIEDTAVVVDEVAVVSAMGATRRRPEVQSVAAVLEQYRPLKFITLPGTLEGGDVVRVGRTLYVGLSTRTNAEGVRQLRELLKPYDYEVACVGVHGCLHLSTGCSYLGRGTVLLNPDWIDPSPFRHLDIIRVPPTEPWAANTLSLDGVVLLPSSFPETRALLEERGFEVYTTDISEFMKAEAGLTCMSLLFTDHQAHLRDADNGRSAQEVTAPCIMVPAV